MAWDPGEAQFRKWLIAKLKQSRWGNYRGESIETLAERLGLHPSVLVDAQAELNDDRKAAGRLPTTLGAPHRRPITRAVAMAEIDLPFAEPVYRDWAEYCRLRDLTESVLLRSLIAVLLLGPSNPRWVGRTWLYHGHVLKLEGYGRCMEEHRKWPWCVQTEIPHGAMRALTMRATALGTTATAMARGMVLELLEGRLTQLFIVPTPTQMWDDENRYWTGKEDA